jgi:hypothetical protein
MEYSDESFSNFAIGLDSVALEDGTELPKSQIDMAAVEEYFDRGKSVRRVDSSDCLSPLQSCHARGRG